MSTTIDVEDIESTRSEKFLAVVLTAFLLIGSIWFYVKVDDWVGGGDRGHEYTSAEQHTIDANQAAWAALEQANRLVESERVDLDLARDKLQLASNRGEPTQQLEATYDREQSEFAAARDAADERQAEADEAQKKTDAIYQKADQQGTHTTGERWAIAGVRLAAILVELFGSLLLLGRLRRAHSRFLALGFACAATAVITALVYAGDYILDYIDPLDLGPLVLSAIGAAATVASFVGLQRYLARRIPGRRVRKGECPFCGFPVREDALVHGRDHCEGCGRDVVAACAACSQPRRVGSPHCSSCGAA